MNILFVCTENVYRSKTAEEVFSSSKKHAIRSAGTSDTATHQITQEDIDWAEIIFVMEKAHKNKISKKFSINGTRLICLEIPDDYDFMQAELIRLLKSRVAKYIREI